MLALVVLANVYVVVRIWQILPFGAPKSASAPAPNTLSSPSARRTKPKKNALGIGTVAFL